MSKLPLPLASHVGKPRGIPNSSESDGLSLVQIGQAAHKHWLILLLTTMSVAIVIAFYVLGQTKLHRSTMTMLIDPDPPQPLGKDVERVVDFSAYWSNKEYHATQVQIIQSRQVALEVVRRLNLHRDQGFIENLPKGQQPARPDVSVQRAARVLLERLSVKVQSDTRIVEVSYEDADPERARRVLEALADTYIHHNLDELAATSQSASEWLRGQLTKLKGELERSELALHEYKKDKRILSVSFDDQTNMLRDEMGQLNTRITTLRAERARLQSRLKTLEQMAPESIERLPASAVLHNPMLETLREDYLSAVRERDELAASGKGENHPRAQAVRSRVSGLQVALVAEIGNVTRGTAQDLRALDGELARIEGLYEGAKQRALDLNLLDIEFQRLARLKKNNEKLYSMVLERSKETDLAALMHVNNIRVLDAPLDGTPVGLRVPLQIGFGVLVGLLIGLAAAVAREALDRTVKSPSDVEEELGLTVIGVLPKERGEMGSVSTRRRGSASISAPTKVPGPLELAVHEAPQSAVAEAARALRTNLLFMSPDRPHRTILVTSPGPGDGKSTVASWIAIAMAQAGHRVLLLDCDLRRPRIHQLFSTEAACTTAEAILDRSLLDRSDLTTEVPNLSCLPARGHVPNPAELLGSASFNALLADLEKRYDRVVLDSPPVGAVTDATILSTRADCTVLVLRAMRTAKELTKRAALAIRSVDGNLVGAVINATSPDRGYPNYYYYYSDRAPARDDAA